MQASDDHYYNDKPDFLEPMFCHNLYSTTLAHDSNEGSIEISVNNAVDNSPIAEASVNAENGDYSVMAATDKEGKVTLSVSHPGTYRVTVEAAGFIRGTITTNLDSKNNLVAKSLIGLSPELGEDEIRAILNWNENAKNLNLHILQVSQESDGKETCETNWNIKNLCSKTGVEMNIENSLDGLVGSETITLSNVSTHFQNTYLSLIHI